MATDTSTHYMTAMAVTRALVHPYGPGDAVWYELDKRRDEHEPGVLHVRLVPAIVIAVRDTRVSIRVEGVAGRPTRNVLPGKLWFTA